MLSCSNTLCALTDWRTSVGSDIVVRLKWGETEYRGRLVSVDSYMNVQLSECEEYIDGKNKGTLGQVLIRYVWNNPKSLVWRRRTARWSDTVSQGLVADEIGISGVTTSSGCLQRMRRRITAMSAWTAETTRTVSERGRNPKPFERANESYWDEAMTTYNIATARELPRHEKVTETDLALVENMVANTFRQWNTDPIEGRKSIPTKSDYCHQRNPPSVQQQKVTVIF